jgi:hypothetical protein
MAALMSKLDAVNKMLESVWEQPVSTLQVSGVASVAMAKRVLDETTVSVQSRGWAFNTEENIVLQPDVNQNIQLPNNALEVSPMGIDRDVQGVMRGTLLYDRENHTYAFTKSVNVRLITLLDFEDMPQVARFYVAVSAARVFRDQFQQKDTTSPPTQVEVEALRDVEENEGITDKANVFCGSYSVANIIDRNF